MLNCACDVMKVRSLAKIPLIKFSYVPVAQQCAQNCKIPHIGVCAWDITAIMSEKRQELCSSVMEPRNCCEEVTNLVTPRQRGLWGDSEFIRGKETCSCRKQELPALWLSSITSTNTACSRDDVVDSVQPLGWRLFGVRMPAKIRDFPRGAVSVLFKGYRLFPRR
jgi:hypothetical protein